MQRKAWHLVSRLLLHCEIPYLRTVPVGDDELVPLVYDPQDFSASGGDVPGQFLVCPVLLSLCESVPAQRDDNLQPKIW